MNRKQFISFVELGLLIVFVIFIALFFRAVLKTNSQNEKFENNYVTPSPKPVKTTQTTKHDSTVSAYPEKGNSIGIFFPFMQGVIINNTKPYILGKIYSGNEPLLNYSYNYEVSPLSFEEEPFIRFDPGVIQNANVFVDNQRLQSVYAIPQYPTISCLDYADGTTHDGKYKRIVTALSRDDCFEKHKNALPPIIFFSNVNSPLSEGNHTIKVETKYFTQEMSFTVDSEFRYDQQKLFEIEKSDRGLPAPLSSLDNCVPGYYYDKNHLKIPIPHFDNNSLYYQIAFPQAKNDIGSGNNVISINFDGNLFPLFLPHESAFFKSEKENNSTMRLNDFHQLFVPIDMLTFQNGTKAMLRDAKELEDDLHLYADSYLEIVPIDTTGGMYSEFILPFVTTNSSSCDG